MMTVASVDHKATRRASRNERGVGRGLSQGGRVHLVVKMEGRVAFELIVPIGD